MALAVAVCRELLKSFPVVRSLPCEGDAVIIPILQINKLRHKEMKSVGQGLEAADCQSRDPGPGRPRCAASGSLVRESVWPRGWCPGLWFSASPFPLLFPSPSLSLSLIISSSLYLH